MPVPGLLLPDAVSFLRGWTRHEVEEVRPADESVVYENQLIVAYLGKLEAELSKMFESIGVIFPESPIQGKDGEPLWCLHLYPKRRRLLQSPTRRTILRISTRILENNSSQFQKLIANSRKQLITVPEADREQVENNQSAVPEADREEVENNQSAVPEGVCEALGKLVIRGCCDPAFYQQILWCVRGIQMDIELQLIAWRHERSSFAFLD